MKSNLLILVVACMLASLSSCTAHKVQGVNLNGTYTLTNVSSEGTSGNYRTTVFGDVPASCLNGSVWNLPNNGKGSYTISDSSAECIAGTRQIYWSLRSDNGINYFQFKKLDSGAQAKDIQEGYRLELTQTSADGFTLRAPIEGTTSSTIVYTFTKQ